MRGVWVQCQRQWVGLDDAHLVGQLTVPYLSSSSDRGEGLCHLGSPCRPPVTVGGDTRCRSGVVPLQPSPPVPASPTRWSAPSATARSRTRSGYSSTWHSSSRARRVALSTRLGDRGTLPVRSLWAAFCGTKCTRAGRRHRPPPLTVPCEVSEPLALEAAWRQLAGCHPVHGGEIVEALSE
jgi:hypothetical protein